jgi:hypothetical protein
MYIWYGMGLVRTDGSAGKKKIVNPGKTILKISTYQNRHVNAILSNTATNSYVGTCS